MADTRTVNQKLIDNTIENLFLLLVEDADLDQSIRQALIGSLDTTLPLLKDTVDQVFGTMVTHFSEISTDQPNSVSETFVLKKVQDPNLRKVLIDARSIYLYYANRGIPEEFCLNEAIAFIGEKYGIADIESFGISKEDITRAVEAFKTIL